MLPRDQRPEDAPKPCDCCGARAETVVWQFEVCWACYRDWQANTENPPEAMEYPRRLTDERIWALYRERAAAWLTAAKARRAA